MGTDTPDTIFAAASGFGRAAVCVIRLSGPGSRSLLEAVASPLPAPRHMSLRTLSHPRTRERLDQALVVWMPGPASFTGEDQAEIHLHGSLAVRSAVLRALGEHAGCRPAEAGEFTRRAFLNGRLDLSQVEGLADLIDAETEAQRRQALRQLEGRLGHAVEAWRESLLQALALLEAALDFADEGDVPAGLEAEAERLVAEVDQEIARSLSAPGGERLREGFTVVIAGPPNAGKSTLLNVLARRDVAIVSPVAGTTRDAIEVRCDLGGMPVTFVDTAGLRDSDDPVEQEGVSRARARAATADLVLWLVPPGGQAPVPPADARTLRVATKTDLGRYEGNRPSETPSIDLRISAKTGQGLDALLARIEQAAGAALGQGDAVITRERHRRALARAVEATGRGLGLLRNGHALELAAEDVRLATRAVGEITGRVDVEDVLDRLFSTFCIGK